jgi:hypothetical protein
VHGQIEVTPVWGGSTCTVMIALGAAGAGEATRARLQGLAGFLLVGFGVAWGTLAVPRTARWERALIDAASRVAVYADLTQRVVALRDSKGPADDSIGRIASDIGKSLAMPAPTDDATLTSAMDRLLARGAAEAAIDLTRAMSAWPRHLQTVEAYCKMKLGEAAAKARLGAPDAEEVFDQAVSAAERQAQFPSAGAFGLLGNVLNTEAEVLRRPELVGRAVDAWTKAAAMDPYGLSFPYRVFEAELAQGHAEAARRWAGKLTELDKLQRLDELKRLTPEQRAKVQGATRLP